MDIIFMSALHETKNKPWSHTLPKSSKLGTETAVGSYWQAHNSRSS
jgi:hypothetical protein